MHYAFIIREVSSKFCKTSPPKNGESDDTWSNTAGWLVNTSCSFWRWLPVFRQFSYSILCSTQQGRGCSCQYSRIRRVGDWYCKPNEKCLENKNPDQNLGVLHNRKLAPAALYMDSQPQHGTYILEVSASGWRTVHTSSRHLLPSVFFEAQTGSSSRKAESCGDGKRTLSNWHQQVRFANVTGNRISDPKRDINDMKRKISFACFAWFHIYVFAIIDKSMFAYIPPLPLQIPLYKRCKYTFAVTVYHYISISV